MADINERDAKLIEMLSEAYGKERQLETALQAHIAMTTRAPYKKRLQAHLRETKGHVREVQRRIKALGGSPGSVDLPGPEVVSDVAGGAAGQVLSAAQKAAALAQGQWHMLRGTTPEDKMMRNARTEYTDEAHEIAIYHSIEALAEAVGDRDTARVAKSIRREEERMADFLEKEIARMAKASARAEIPAAQRTTGRRRSSRRTASRATAKRSSAKRTGASRTTAKRSTSSRAASKRTGAARSASSRSAASRGRSR